MKKFFFVFFVLFFTAAAQAADECPENWKEGDEFLYPAFCRPRDAKSRWSVSDHEELRKFDLRGLPKPPVAIDESDGLVSDTKYLAALNGVMMGLLLNLPEDVTMWTKHENLSTFEVWEKHVHGLPAMDKDSWKWNYVAHPIAGAAYYQVCRERNFSFGQCYVYSFLVSALIWEYGWEATRERPSIQDLIITPTAGALLGEIAHKLSNEIRSNNGKVLGSYALGQSVLALLNPLGTVIEEVRKVVDPLGQKLNSKPFITYGVRPRYKSDIPSGPHFLQAERRLEIGVTFKLKPGWEQKLLGIF